ncbi:MAG TPA: amidohydrolase family protein [Steroidobacteraceae bacterium]|nr:amidohydrolase family protein [Steroidobacteraceae bacterium]
MPMRTLLALAALLALPLVGAGRPAIAAPGDGVIVINSVTVIHPERAGTDAVSPATTVIVRGGRIEAVLPNAAIELPQGATVIDGRGKYLIPGLVDSHVHFFQSGNLYTRPDAADFNAVVPYSTEVARNQARLPYTFKVWLASGVTGVVDIGGPFWNFEVRDRAAATAEAPEMAVAGPLISMVDRPQLDLGDPPIIRIDSPDAARALVARQLPRKPDYIKVWFIHRQGDDLAAQEAIVKAAGDAAHEAGLKLAVHATELVVAKAALRAGANFLVHSVFDQPVDDEFIALIKARDALYCPTLFVVQGYPLALSGQWRPTPIESLRADPQILLAMDDLTEIPADKLPERVKKLMAEAKPGQMLTSSSTVAAAPKVGMDNLRRLVDAGVTVVMGTDAGNIGTLHGPSIHREFALMRESGLTPAEILRTATVNGARALGLADSAGRIAPGMRADLVLLDADPLADVANLQRVRVVLKDGVAYEPRELLGKGDGSN